MAFFFGLLSLQLVIWLISKGLKKGPFQSFWSAALLALPLMFSQVGLVHLLKPDSLTYMIDCLLPNARLIIVLTGIFEVLVPWGLLIPKYRNWTAYILIGYLVVIFPANIHVAMNGLAAPGGLPSAPWYTWSRLLFQPVYICWVWRASTTSRQAFTNLE